MGLIKIAATGAALKGLFSAIGKDIAYGGKSIKNAVTPQFMRKAKVLLHKNKQLRNQIANQTKSHAEEIANASKTALQGQKDQALHDKKKLRKTIIGLAAGSLGADAVMNAAWYRKTKKLKKEQNV